MSAPSKLEAYLEELRRALRLYPGDRAEVLDEVRDHLLSARERAREQGCADEEAERRACAAFGRPRALARRYVAQRGRRRLRVLLPLALAAGIALGWMDSSPGWDDTGISVLALLATSGLLGLLDPTRPWLWALAVGAWIPLFELPGSHNWGALVALAFALVGAYGGSFVRRLAAS